MGMRDMRASHTLLPSCADAGSRSGSAALPRPSRCPLASAVLQLQPEQPPSPTRLTSAARPKTRKNASSGFAAGYCLTFGMEAGGRARSGSDGSALWHGGEDDWEPLPDLPDLVEARDELLTTLAGAADHVPADEWILGQRIRYLGEAGPVGGCRSLSWGLWGCGRVVVQCPGGFRAPRHGPVRGGFGALSPWSRDHGVGGGAEVAGPVGVTRRQGFGRA